MNDYYYLILLFTLCIIKKFGNKQPTRQKGHDDDDGDLKKRCYHGHTINEKFNFRYCRRDRLRHAHRTIYPYH